MDMEIEQLKNKLKEEAELHEQCMNEYRREMNKVISQLKNKEK